MKLLLSMIKLARIFTVQMKNIVTMLSTQAYCYNSTNVMVVADWGNCTWGIQQ